MIPLYQSKLHRPPHQKGNCFATCIASILEIEIEDVIPMEDLDLTGAAYWDALAGWANKQSLQPQFRYFSDAPESETLERVPLDYYKENMHRLAPLGYSILTGKSPRGSWDHCVVALNGEIIHDPSPMGLPPYVEDVRDFIWFEKLCDHDYPERDGRCMGCGEEQI